MGLWDKAKKIGKGLVSWGARYAKPYATIGVGIVAAAVAISTGNVPAASKAIGEVYAAYKEAQRKLAEDAGDPFVYVPPDSAVKESKIPWIAVVPASIERETVEIASVVSLVAGLSGMKNAESEAPSIARFLDREDLGGVHRSIVLKSIVFAKTIDGTVVRKTSEEFRDALKWVSMVSKQRAIDPSSPLWYLSWRGIEKFAPSVVPMLQKTYESQIRSIEIEKKRVIANSGAASSDATKAAYDKPKRSGGTALLVGLIVVGGAFIVVRR